MIRLAVACQGTQYIRTHPANFYTSAARDFFRLRCRGDLSSYDVGETPDDQLDFKRHCPISICLEARSIGVRQTFSKSRKIGKSKKVGFQLKILENRKIQKKSGKSKIRKKLDFNWKFPENRKIEHFRKSWKFSKNPHADRPSFKANWNWAMPFEI